MCGILAVIDLEKGRLDSDLILKMRDTMIHRGPDDAGLYIEGPVGLAHRRLSIIDLSETGHQPMTNEDSSIVIVFNGEIFNYVELRLELIKRGHIFSSMSDTEVIIHQYEEDGEECLQKFNGMFSFVIWDSNKKKLFAARDRAGIKPLYYYFNGRKIILASEIKAILEDSAVVREADYEGIYDYFFAGRSLEGKTVFKNIREVEPGHLIVFNIENRGLQFKRYWDVIFNYNTLRGHEETREELFYLLDDAIKLHSRSDAPLGCHLSGGLDTSTVVGFAARHRQSLKTFSIKFSDDAFIDETSYAKAVAEKVGAEYHEDIPPALDIIRLLPFLIWHMDIPMANPGGFAYYTCSRLVSKYIKVALTGHGGDEVFAGYPAQFQAAFHTTSMFDLYSDPHDIQQPFYKKLTTLLSIHGPSKLYHTLKNRIRKNDITLEDKWIRLHCGYTNHDSGFFDPLFVKNLHGYTPKESYIESFKKNSTASVLDKCLYHDLCVYLPSLLHLEDRASMAVSIESRVPLLDYRIIEYMATVPPDKKVRDLKPKYLLRAVGSEILPQTVLERRDKRPFPIPVTLWHQKQVRDMVEKILLSKESLNRGIISARVLKESCRYVGSPPWQLLNLELWFKIFIDRESSWIDAGKSLN